MNFTNYWRSDSDNSSKCSYFYAFTNALRVWASPVRNPYSITLIFPLAVPKFVPQIRLPRPTSAPAVYSTFNALTVSKETKFAGVSGSTYYITSSCPPFQSTI